MALIADQRYLRQQQYHDATNFNARIALHERFSTGAQRWPRWAFEQLRLPAQSRILEIGCGTGNLWRANAERIPAGWDVTLSDFAPGMLAAARDSLATVAHPLRFVLLDAQAIPFAAASFDAVIANHMLYHVPNRPRALAEIRRVLRPGGTLYAATNGQRHLAELHALAARVDPALAAWGGRLDRPFLLETGGDELARCFDPVTLARHEDGLVVTEAEPLVAFVASMSSVALTAEQHAALHAAATQAIARDGALRITKDPGMFVAVRPADL